MQYYKNCKICMKPFKTGYWNQEYCSDFCRNEGNAIRWRWNRKLHKETYKERIWKKKQMEKHEDEIRKKVEPVKKLAEILSWDQIEKELDKDKKKGDQI